jgi:hypothetical protein
MHHCAPVAIIGGVATHLEALQILVDWHSRSVKNMVVHWCTEETALDEPLRKAASIRL